MSAVAAGDLVLCRLADGSEVIHPPTTAINLVTEYGNRWTCDFGPAGEVRQADALAAMPPAAKGKVNCASVGGTTKTLRPKAAQRLGPGRWTCGVDATSSSQACGLSPGDRASRLHHVARNSG
jgi:hypothetical protein